MIRMIHLLPQGGLCNRLRAIESSIRFARSVNAKLYVHWISCSEELNAKYYDLFEQSPPGVCVIDNCQPSIITRALFSRFNPFRYRDVHYKEMIDYCRNTRSVICVSHSNWAAYYRCGEEI